MGKILVFASGKGGTGKSSLCAGIASCLAEKGNSVLAVDFDLGLRNLDISLGLSDTAAVTFPEVMNNSCGFDDAAQHGQLPDLRLLTAPQSMDGVDETLLPEFCGKIKDRFDFCLFDAPAGIGPVFRLAVGNADEAVIVAGADPASLRDGAAAAEEAFRLGISHVGLIVNRVQKKLFTGMNVTVDDVMDATGLPLLGIVPEDASVPLAAAKGTLLIREKPRGAARACQRIADRLMGRHVTIPRRL